MPVDPKYYLHKSDAAALNALKAIPGFSKLMKSFMGIMYERQFRITNMSTNVRISEKQLKVFHDMLFPICEKLGIEEPELYLDIDPYPNAYTYGDTNPFIVITSGLIETIPEELIPTVLAHECGHIACHHTLYTTMGNFILNSSSFALSMLPFGSFLSLPLQVAFYYWMRCSEYSADRAAAIVDGTADKMSEVCMRLAGFDKDINYSANIDEFMNQALDYRELIKDSKWNKTLEFIFTLDKDHPLTSVRALEISEWANSENYKKILNGTITDDDIDLEDGISCSDIDKSEELTEPKKKKIELPKLHKKWIKQEENTDDFENCPINPAIAEIRAFKSLLDDGIITQDEFESKKKELLKL